MENILTESLEILRPHLAPPLFAPEILPQLGELVRRLVPTPSLRIGFECRLGPDVTQVDVQQCFTRRADEPKMLADHVAALMASTEAPLHPAWRRIDSFCAEWRDPESPLHDIAELWLEFDLEPGTAAPAAPSVFFGLDQMSQALSNFSTAETALNLFTGRPLSAGLRSNLHSCFDACAERAVVSHIGVMLARETEALRVNIKHLPAYEFPDFLERIGWPGIREESFPLLVRLCSRLDAITICLDIGPEISPRIGLECFLRWQPGREVRWEAFLGDLVAIGLCSAEKASALMMWPGYTDPSSTSAPWPAALVAQSLLQQPDRFSVLNRELMHLKVTSQPGRPPEAKAYFGFLQSWLLPDIEPKEEISEVAAVPQSRRPASEESEIAAALEAATGFLLSARSKTGWWLEYDGFEPGGASDEWVTGYVGTAIAALPDERCRRAAEWAWGLLAARREPCEGWGLNASVPADADSTLWGLRLAEGVGARESERALRAREFLLRHSCPSGGVATYVEDYFRSFTGHSSLPGIARTWVDPHTCVTAAAAGLAGMGESTRPYLRKTQKEDGRWNGYWWSDDEYTTALAAEALAMSGEPEDQRCVQLSVQWALSRVGLSGAVPSDSAPDGSAFATAFCIRTLALAEDSYSVRETLRRSVGWLLEHQRPDGSWPPAATFCANPAEDPVRLIPECRGVFTTATVILALRAIRG